MEEHMASGCKLKLNEQFCLILALQGRKLKTKYYEAFAWGYSPYALP